MLKFGDQIGEYIDKLQSALNNIDKAQLNTLAELLMDAYQKQSQILVFGNGGSALTASHLACDLNKGASAGLESRWRVISLTDNIGTIMAYANDVSYDEVFIEQLKNFLNPGDLVIGFSGSGNSTNVLKAIEYANSRGAITVGVTGYDGGKLSKVARFSVDARIDDMQISEDVHMVVVHLLMKVLLSACKKITAPC